MRLTWLETMAAKHENQQHFAEAGMCKIHCAALVSEYMHMLEDCQYMPTGAVTFEKLTPNAVEESAVSGKYFPQNFDFFPQILNILPQIFKILPQNTSNKFAASEL